MKLAAHPRLFIGPTELKKLNQEPAMPFLIACNGWVKKMAARWALIPPLKYRRNTHNEHLGRAREVQTRVVTLLARWQQTGKERFRTAVLEHVRMMGDWDCWSWITWRRGDFAPDAIFDLSYGENAATLAMAYDWLFDTLTAAEKDFFLAVANHWVFPAGDKFCRKDGASWYCRPDSNWNTVCAGGLGMLCLSMYEEVPLARRILPRVERSFKPYMEHLNETDGAWPEGTGYWNYGMHYAFIYLRSWEHALGKRHPLLKLRGARQTLSFPLDFCPNAQPCSFGDVNHWGPQPSHYDVARELGEKQVIQGIDGRLTGLTNPGGGRAAAALWLLLHDGRPALPRKPKRCGAKLYKGLDWGIIADHMPHPELYMSIRGGTTEVPHGHNDLLSCNVVVGSEKLIANVGNREYLDTTFSSRRYELPDINAQYKNTIMLNGVGIAHGAALQQTEVIKGTGWEGVRLVATEAMGYGRDGPAAKFCGRAALLLDDAAFLIVDRVQTRHPARVESRLHSYAEVRTFKAGALLKGAKESLRISYAANVPPVLASASTAPTTPTAPPATMLRWCTEKLHKDMVLVTLLTPGRRRAKVGVEYVDTRIRISVETADRRQTVKLKPSLLPA